MIRKLFVVGFGNIGMDVAELLDRNSARIKEAYGVELRIVAAADTSGIVGVKDGLELSALVNVKKSTGKVSNYRENQIKTNVASEVFDQVDADILVELTSGDIRTGNPGIDNIVSAMEEGMDVVTTNKTALARGFERLIQNAKKNDVALKFRGAAYMTIPSVDLQGFRELGMHIEGVEALVNATSNYVLTALSAGRTMREAIDEVRAAGLTERDPAIDLDGWDTACKMVILANSWMNAHATLEDVKVDGVTKTTAQDIAAAKREGYAIKAAGEIETGNGKILIRSNPKRYPLNHFLATTVYTEKAMVLHSSVGDISVKTEQAGPRASAFAIIQDLIDIVKERPGID